MADFVSWTPDAIADVLNSFPFVAWDRMVDAPVEGGHRSVSVYGWIDRADDHHDFLILTFCSWYEGVPYSTSSAARSEEINRILSGPDAPHYDCERVEDVLGARVTRTVVLSP
jgi:hypothetical protein